MLTSINMPDSRSMPHSEMPRRRRRIKSGTPKRSYSSSGGRRCLGMPTEYKCLQTGNLRAWWQKMPSRQRLDIRGSGDGERKKKRRKKNKEKA
jgi:hypothetical protein